jgi:small subunit ribosomal protein S3
MGQKVHPLGFRLGVTKNYSSNWFVKPNLYSNFLLEDFLIRQNIEKFFKLLLVNDTNSFFITDVKIYRKFNQIEILVNSASTSSLFTTKNNSQTKSEILESLRIFLIKKLKPLYLHSNESKIFPRIIINISECSNVNLNVVFIAKCLILDLENRIPFRRALKRIIRRVQKQEKLFGIKIKISGRLNGIEMARSEWVKKGRIPLQTINADIDYHNDIAKTIYGILGIKIWIYKEN